MSLLDWSSVGVGVPNRLTWAFTAPSASRSLSGVLFQNYLA
jgi:hypothetical protein